MVHILWRLKGGDRRECSEAASNGHVWDDSAGEEEEGRKGRGENHMMEADKVIVL